MIFFGFFNFLYLIVSSMILISILLFCVLFQSQNCKFVDEIASLEWIWMDGACLLGAVVMVMVAVVLVQDVRLHFCCLVMMSTDWMVRVPTERTVSAGVSSVVDVVWSVWGRTSVLVAAGSNAH